MRNSSEESPGNGLNVKGAVVSAYVTLVKKEIESYWFFHLTRRGTIVFLLVAITSVIIAFISLIALTTNLVEYYGPVLYGYVSPIAYDLRTNGLVLVYRHLDSVVLASRLTLLFTLVILVYDIVGFSTIMGTITKPKESSRALLVDRAVRRDWISFVLLSPVGSGLLIMLVFSLIRVLAYDIIPDLHRTIYVTSTTGRVYLSSPIIKYTWTMTNLAWRPMVFIILFIVASFATVITVIYVLLTPRQPVAKISRSKKVISKFKNHTDRKQTIGHSLGT